MHCPYLKNYDQISDGDLYPFDTVAKRFGISRRTLERARAGGLPCAGPKKTHIYGRILRAAINGDTALINRMKAQSERFVREART